MNRWGDEGPPAEAYSRVTAPERFQPLHAAASDLLLTLPRQFDVVAHEGVQDPDLARGPLGRSIVRFIPNIPSAAQVTVAFTTFPSLLVRFGRWHIESFPACGCDACDETAEAEVERFSWMVTQVVDGRFRESTLARLGRGFYQTYELWSLQGERQSGETLIEKVTPEIRAAKDIVLNWAAWPRKEA